jgi:hypothetical protein
MNNCKSVLVLLKYAEEMVRELPTTGDVQDVSVQIDGDGVTVSYTWKPPIPVVRLTFDITADPQIPDGG